MQYSITYEDRLVNGKVQPREAELLIWAIAPTGTITFRTVDLIALEKSGTTLNDLVATNRDSIGVRGRGLDLTISSEPQAADQTTVEEARRRASQLYTLLIQPIADALPKDPNARITFIPQRSLFLVPFATCKTHREST